MSWFKSRREKELEELCKSYKEKLDELKTVTPNYASSFVHVAAPTPEDMKAYHMKISALTADPLYLFYLVQLRRSVVDEFEIVGKGESEFYRGKLALIGTVFNDAKKARKELGVQ